MSALPLGLEPHAVLRARTQPVTDFSQALRTLAQDLIDTMYAHDGIGLAAPQVGHVLQLFVVNPSQERGRELIVVNPVLEATRGRVTIKEGCLSLPNVWERVRRAARVRVTGQDVSGRPLTLEADGLLAIVLQHECDHLEGRLFIDRLSWFRRVRLGVRVRPGSRRPATDRTSR